MAYYKNKNDDRCKVEFDINDLLALETENKEK